MKDKETILEIYLELLNDENYDTKLIQEQVTEAGLYLVYLSARRSFNKCTIGCMAGSLRPEDKTSCLFKCKLNRQTNIVQGLKSKRQGTTNPLVRKIIDLKLKLEEPYLAKLVGRKEGTYKAIAQKFLKNSWKALTKVR